MKILERKLFVKIPLCILLIANLALVSIESSFAAAKMPVITDEVNSNPNLQIKTNKYYFYMPDDWKSTSNDNYDGVSLNSCCPCIYWWNASYAPTAWPGYRILNQDKSDPHIFYCDVPVDVETIIFNNAVFSGEKSIQTWDLKTKYSTAKEDPYGFYSKLDSMNNMIFVINPLDVAPNDITGLIAKGDWFYYYGNGKYGITPTKGENVFQNGNFPTKEESVQSSVSTNKKAQTIRAKSYTKTYGAKTFDLKAKTSGDGKLTYKSSNTKIIKVSSKGKVTINGCGKTTVTIKASETSTYKSATKKITITVKPGKLKVTGYSKGSRITFKQQPNADGYIAKAKKVGSNFKKNFSTGKNNKSISVKGLPKGKYRIKLSAWKKISGKKIYGKETSVIIVIG